MAPERLTVFPAFHKVAGRPVLVVGEGAEAAAKVRLLLETEAAIRLVAEAASGELLDLVGVHNLEHRARPFQCDDVDGAVLVFAASGDTERDALVVAAARRHNIPVNAVDSPSLCDFFTPAIVNRAPVAVAITSTGAGPVLAQKLRARIEAMLPPRLGALARLGESFRAAAERVLPRGQPRRRFWSAFFDGRIADASLAGQPDEARRLATRLLAQTDGAEKGFVWLVGAGPGDTDLLTLRAQRLLQEADVIVYDDALVPEAIVAMGRRDAARVHLGTTGSSAIAADEVGFILVREAGAGRRVVLLEAGDPLASGRAAGLMQALRTGGILFEVVPGVAAPVHAATDLPAAARNLAA